MLYYYFTHELCLYIEKQSTPINLQSYIKPKQQIKAFETNSNKPQQL